MSQVSKNKLSKEKEKSIQEIFFQLLPSFKTKKNLQQFLESFFTKTEKTMLSKRFFALFLLEKGSSIQEIAQTLKMTHATISKLELQRQLGSESFVSAFKKTNQKLLKNALNDFAKVVGKKIAITLIRGGRIPKPKNSPF